MDPISIITGIITIGLAAWGIYYAREQVKLAREQKKHLLPHAFKPAFSPEVKGQSAENATHVLLQTDFDDSKYRGWLSEEIGYIDIRGIRIGTMQAKSAMRFPILELYTELNVQKGLTNWDLDQGNLSGGQRIPLTKVLEVIRCVAVAGDPGSGKTTFLRYVARKYLEEKSKVLPIYVDLPDLYQFALHKARLNKQASEEINYSFEIEPDIIIHYLIDISEKEKLEFNADGLFNRTKMGNCIFLFDSLDELPSPEIRDLMVDTITKNSRQWNKCKFVIASRPLALSGNAIPLGFEIVGIEPLQNEEIRSFLGRWSSQLFLDIRLQRKFYEDLFSNIIENQQLRSIARNPVMLTCMAVLSYNNRQLPAGRADLLEAVIQWLISSRDTSSRPSKETNEFIAARYSELALAMFEGESGSKNRVGRRWAASTIVSRFDHDISRTLEFLSREENQTGLLVRRGEGDLSFWHSWFLEYLAAKEIANKTDDENTGWWSKIREHLNDARWREVLALVPTCLNRLGSNRVDLFFERLSNTCMHADLPARIKTLGFGGRILRDLLIVGYDPGEVTSWNKLLDDISPIFQNGVTEIPLEDRYEAAVAYGLSGDKRLKSFEDNLVKVPAGIFLMGSQSSDPNKPNFDEFANPWEGPVVEITFDSFEIGKYPVTVKEYKTFVEQKGYQIFSFWSENGWKWLAENKINSPGNWDSQLLYPNCPVTSVSWFEANAYCSWLSKMRGLATYEFSLPSEAEWEYVARREIPDGQRFLWGNHMTEGDLAEANWGGCNLRKKSPVGMFPASNTIDGVSDMFGNVEEWCLDCWSFGHNNYQSNGTARYSESEILKVVRGGSTIRYMRLCRPTYRSRTVEDRRYQTIGFRIVRKVLPQESKSNTKI